MQTVESIQRMFHDWAPEVRPMSRLYGELATSIATDPDIARLLLANPMPEQRTPALLFAAVHDLILEDPSLPLAEWYATLTPSPRSDDAYRPFSATINDARPRIEHTIASRSTQTNEVGRGSFLLPALDRIALEVGPVSLVDVGASAGLNLNLDRYTYRYDGVDLNPPDGPSSVTVICRTDGTLDPPPTMPPIADRRGLDQSPVNLRDQAQARWLQACVWPDQLDRFNRLTAAIEIARAHPANIISGDAVADLNRASDGLIGHPVITNSWTLNYLSPAARNSYVAELNRLGAMRDLSWIFAESPRETPELPHASSKQPQLTHLNLVRWRAGRRTVTHLALCHPHGSRMTWAPADA